MLTVDQLAEACNLPRSEAACWQTYVVAALVYAKAETPLQQALALATWGHESQGFTRLSENLNYKASALIPKFGSRFTPETAEKYGRTASHAADQRMIANIAYGGRNGNSAPDDGWKYRARGLTGLTFFDNYKACGRDLGVDLVKNPDLVTTHQYAALSAGWFFRVNGIHRHSDILTVSRAVNCGNPRTKRMPNGMADRTARFKKAMKVLDKPQSASERAQRMLSQ